METTKIYKVTIQGYCIQEEGMEHPIDWDWNDSVLFDDFLTTPDITVVELVEAEEAEEKDA